MTLRRLYWEPDVTSLVRRGSVVNGVSAFPTVIYSLSSSQLGSGVSSASGQGPGGQWRRKGALNRRGSMGSLEDEQMQQEFSRFRDYHSLE